MSKTNIYFGVTSFIIVVVKDSIHSYIIDRPICNHVYKLLASIDRSIDKYLNQ